MKNKVCIISVYFGKLPEWFDIWLKSAGFNQKIDFIIVTDQNIKFEYKNIKVLKMSFEEFKNLARKKLEFNIKLNHPYKLCDFKEVWGLILKDEIKNYDYWGECDNDVVFGDLYYFLEKYNYQKYDKFGCRGHLTLYKNTSNVMNRYKLKGGWFGSYKEVFSSNKNWAFDETPGINAIYEKYKFPSMNKKIFADIDVNYEDLRLVIFEDSEVENYSNQLFYWKNGKILRAYEKNNQIINDEFMYIHLQKRKMYKPTFNIKNVNEFIITNGYFIEKTDNISINLMKKYNGRNEQMINVKKFGGAYKKDLRFYWLGRRYLNLIFDIKTLIKKSTIYSKIKRG